MAAYHEDLHNQTATLFHVLLVYLFINSSPRDFFLKNLSVCPICNHTLSASSNRAFIFQCLYKFELIGTYYVTTLVNLKEQTLASFSICFSSSSMLVA